MVRQTTKVILLEILGAISLLLITAAAVLAFMLSNGPVSLALFKSNIEAALTESRDGRIVELEALSLQWLPSQRRLFIVAEGLALQDSDGEIAGSAEYAELTLDAGEAFKGNIEILRLGLRRGWLDVKQDMTGNWSVGGNPLPPWEAAALPETPEAWLERTNEILQQTLATSKQIDQEIEFERLTFEDIDIRYILADAAPLTLVADAQGSLQSTSAGLKLDLKGLGQTDFLPESFGYSLAVSPDYTRLDTRLDLGVVPLGDMLSRAGLPVGFEGDMQVTTALTATVTAEQGLNALKLSLEHNQGDILLPQWDERISYLQTDVIYAPLEDQLEIETLRLTGRHIQTDLTGQVDNFLSDQESRRIAVRTPRIDLNLTPMFEREFRFTNLDLRAQVSSDFQSVDLTALRLQHDDLEFNFSGGIDLDVESQPGQIPLRADLLGELQGEASKETVLSFWPVRLGDGGRRFVVDRVETATLTSARAELSLKPDSFAEGFLRDEDLQVSFSYRDGTVRFMDDVQPINAATGTGRLGGNSFFIQAVESAFNDWEMQLLEVDFPTLNPRGADFTVTGIGGGPVVSMMRSLSESQLQIEARTGFDPERLSGEARATFFMRRPALSQVPLKDIAITAKAKVSEAGLTDVIGDLDLVEGQAEVDFTLERLLITGFGDLGESPVQFTWRDGLHDSGGPSTLSASAVVTPDFLNAFGLTGRAFMTGEIPTELQAKIGQGGVQEADIAFDLRESRIDLDEMGWVKPIGEAARVTVRYEGQNETQSSSVRLVSADAELDGDVSLSPTGQLQALQLRRLFIADMADVSGAIVRTKDNRLSANISGPFLNISSFISQMAGFGEVTANQEEGLPILLNAKVERLRLRRDLELTGSQLEIDSTVQGLNLFAAEGVISGVGAIDVRLSRARATDPLSLQLNSSDAGFMAGAFFGLDFIEGGRMQLQGVIGDGKTPTRLNMQLFDTRLSDAPFFTQILSLASLRGLTDTLSGEGVLFTRVEAPIRIGGGRYVIEGARASGPALGLTVNGWVGSDGKGIELDGVLVPSFGVNSMLGGVPIIGDLLVGRDGEGIFSITYSVRGTLEKAQVAVNPLSAVTPGILRRIFENPSDTSIPAELPVDPNRLPPSAKLPDLPEEEILVPLPDRTPEPVN